MAVLRPPQLEGPGTVVGANVRLQGILKDTNDITVHGRVDGEVISDKNVTISESATVKGPVVAQIVTVAGTIRGSINAAQKLELLPSAKVYGAILTQELIIKSGAVFVGKSTMPQEKTETKEGAEDKKEAKAAARPAKEGEEPEPAYELE